MDFQKLENNSLLLQENNLLKLKIQELEDTIATLNATIATYKSKEESISSAIVFAVERSNQLEESRKKLYQLDIQRSRLLYLRLEQVINELYSRYPELKKDSKLADMSEKFKQAVFSQTNPTLLTKDYGSSTIKEDPLRKLLGNIINYIDEEHEVKTIKRADKIETPSQPNIKPTPSSTPTSQSSSGFDLNEALHPRESLEEILKVFDLGEQDN